MERSGFPPGFDLGGWYKVCAANRDPVDQTAGRFDPAIVVDQYDWAGSCLALGGLGRVDQLVFLPGGGTPLLAAA